MRCGIDTGAGVVDADYRGIVYILLFNLGDQDFEGLFLRLSTAPSIRLPFCSVDEGDRIAQLILERIYTPEVSVVDVSQISSCPDLSMTSSYRTWGRPYVVLPRLVRLVDITPSHPRWFHPGRIDATEQSLGPPLRANFIRAIQRTLHPYIQYTVLAVLRTTTHFFEHFDLTFSVSKFTPFSSVYGCTSPRHEV